MKNQFFEAVYRAMCECDAANKPDDFVRSHLNLTLSGLVSSGMISIYRCDIYPSEIVIDYANSVPLSNRVRMFRKELTRENAVIYDVHES